MLTFNLTQPFPFTGDSSPEDNLNEASGTGTMADFLTSQLPVYPSEPALPSCEFLLHRAMLSFASRGRGGARWEAEALLSASRVQCGAAAACSFAAAAGSVQECSAPAVHSEFLGD